jgi:hypothetical protein
LLKLWTNISDWVHMENFSDLRIFADRTKPWDNYNFFALQYLSSVNNGTQCIEHQFSKPASHQTYPYWELYMCLFYTTTIFSFLIKLSSLSLSKKFC